MRAMLLLATLLLSGCCGPAVGVLTWSEDGLWTATAAGLGVEILPMREPESRLDWTRSDLDRTYGGAYRATHLSWEGDGFFLDISPSNLLRYVGGPNPSPAAVETPVRDLLGAEADSALAQLWEGIRHGEPSDQEAVVAQASCCHTLPLDRFSGPVAWERGHGRIDAGWVMFVEVALLRLHEGDLDVTVAGGDLAMARQPGAEEAALVAAASRLLGRSVPIERSYGQDGGYC